MESVLFRLSSFDHCACGGWLTWGWRNNTPNPQGASRPRPKLAGQPATLQNQKNPRSPAPRDNQVPNQRRVGGRTNPLAHLQPWCEMKWDTMGRGGRRGGSPSLVLLLLFYHLAWCCRWKVFLPCERSPWRRQPEPPLCDTSQTDSSPFSFFSF